MFHRPQRALHVLSYCKVAMDNHSVTFPSWGERKAVRSPRCNCNTGLGL